MNIMNKILVIIESPGKIKKISSLLGDNYIIKASIGHIRDLDKNNLSIDIENNFKPNYLISSDKTKIVKELQDILSKNNKIIIATDNDREGEGIAEGLRQVLKIKEYDRIVFTEITSKAIQNALKNPIKINMNLVNAQEARRILDRLMGYIISPVLWKYLNNDAKSAGRVQSVVNRIIIDKENEITGALSNKYYKTIGYFDKLVSILDNNYINDFLELINKKTEIKICNIENKVSIRKPSSPFITSTLQQEASTKLHFNVKKTMDVAQKLYESGLITYMRTDSPNISEDISKECKTYIINTLGDNYSDPKNYESKSHNAQEAHECIRPTHIDNINPDNITNDQKKLYTLIWKRTIASQMANAEIDKQIISINLLNSKTSILLFNNKQHYFVANLETIKFDGFLLIYNNIEKDTSETEQPITHEYKVGDLLKLKKISISEEYTKLPLRYNEAGLIKYLEKNGIGRPSTFSSIISKGIENKYMEIKDITGIKKESKILELSSKYKITESIKEIIIGNETKKIVPTEIGIQLNAFLMKHFSNIINIKFTSQMEEHLDLIALGKANYSTIIRNFYDMFNPTVQQLLDDAKNIKKELGSSTDNLLGITKDGNEIYIGVGKFGPYVKTKDTNSDNKWKYASIKDIDKKELDLEYAEELLLFPKILGKISNNQITLNKGQYGLYLKCGMRNIAIKDTIDINKIDLDYATKMFNSHDNKSFKIKDKTINIRNGNYGPYIQIVSLNKTQNISIPHKYNLETITVDDIMQIIANKNNIIKNKK
jgi:DNA topoisomerase-1